MKKHFLALVIFSFLLSKVTGQDLTDKVDSYIQSYQKKRLFSGSVLVMKDNNIILRKGYGFKNDATKAPVIAETKFRIASLTKSFTALALFQLEEAGKLKLEDLVSKYVPDFKEGNKISLTQVMHHTAGIPDFVGTPEYQEKLRGYCSAEEAVSLFSQLPLRFDPGSKWEYSNAGYVLLGYIIEKITGQQLENYFHNHIFKPLGMENTGWENEIPIESLGATGYYLQNGKREQMPLVHMSVNHGAGALYSTIDDLYKWDRALYTEKLLSQSGLQKIFTPHLNGYGGGWGITQNPRFDGKPTIFMNGRFSGFSANITRYTQDDICIIVLSNLMDIDPRVMANDISAILFDSLVINPSSRNRVDVSPDILKKYVGTYFFEKTTPQITLEIFVENNRIFRKIEGRPDKELIPSSDDEFYYTDADVDIVFRKNKKGIFDKMLMNLLGSPFLGVRK